MAIERSSPEFLFGQIMARLNEGERTMQGLSEEVKGVGKTLNSLPCVVHERRISEVEEWREDCENHSIRQAGIQIKFRQGIVLVFITVVVNALVSLLIGMVV